MPLAPHAILCPSAPAVDDTEPTMSTSQSEHEVRDGPRYRRANFWYHVAEGAFWSFGESLVSRAEVLPVLAVTMLGVSNAQLGLLNTAVGFAFLAPLLVAHRMEAARRKKRLILLIGLPIRLPKLVTVMALVLLGARHPQMCFLVIALCVLVNSAFVTISIPPWMDLIAETVEPGRVGRMFGYRTSISSVLGAAAGPACALIIARLAFPWDYSALYTISLISLTVSWVLFTRVDEMPDHVKPRERQPARHYFRELMAAIRSDRNYRRFLAYRSLTRVRMAAAPFLATAAVLYHGMGAAIVIGTFIVVRRIGAVVGTLTGPWLAERVTHRRVIQIGGLLTAAAALGAGFAPLGAWWPYVAAIFLGSVGESAEAVSATAFALRIYPRGRRVGYTTMSIVALAPLALVAGPAAGWVMDRWGHALLFYGVAVTIVLSLLPVQLCRPEEDEASSVNRKP